MSTKSDENGITQQNQVIVRALVSGIFPEVIDPFRVVMFALVLMIESGVPLCVDYRLPFVYQIIQIASNSILRWFVFSVLIYIPICSRSRVEFWRDLSNQLHLSQSNPVQNVIIPKTGSCSKRPASACKCDHGTADNGLCLSPNWHNCDKQKGCHVAHVFKQVDRYQKRCERI